MWVFVKNDDVFTVGFFDPTGKWYAVADYATAPAAAKRVHYLNGGNWEGREEDT